MSLYRHGLAQNATSARNNKLNLSVTYMCGLGYVDQLIILMMVPMSLLNQNNSFFGVFSAILLCA